MIDLLQLQNTCKQGFIEQTTPFVVCLPIAIKSITFDQNEL